jgi:DNA-binding MarR family transcriptional regulator
MSVIDFNGLDTAVHGPLRLGVLTTLQTQGGQDFTALKQRLETTDGALGMHLQKLEEIGYIRCQKAFVGRRPKSTYTITPPGRRALLKYIETLEAVVELVRGQSGGRASK